MGCASSKLDDLPAVSLCRERCGFLDDAIRRRYELADSHVAYAHSLRSVGHALRSFLVQDFTAVAPPPELTLPPPSGKGKSVISHDSDSGSHLHFHSDSDSDNSLHHDHDHDHDDHSPHQIAPNFADRRQTLPGPGPAPYQTDPYPGQGYSYPGQGYPYPGQGYPYPAGGYGQNMNFMKKSPTPSVLHRQRPAVSETVQVREISYMKKKTTPSVVYEQRPMNPNPIYTGEASSSYNSYPYQNNSVNSYPTPFYGYSNYGAGPGAENGGYGNAVAAKPPPPPPSPPKSSGWDFLNPFESYERYYAAYNTPSRDSRELREEEGIPDLEDEEDFHHQHEVVKEVYGHQRLVDDEEEDSEEDHDHSDDDSDGEEDVGKGKEGVAKSASHYQTRPGLSEEKERMKEYEVHVVEKKVVDGGGGGEERRPEGGRRGGAGGFKDDSEVAREIEVQFERASESGNEIAKMLEVGKLPYKTKHVSSKMLHIVTPSLSVVSSQPSTSSEPSNDTVGPALLGFEEDIAMRTGNLSSTLHKLLLWEKKLYNEVKAEEKMRVVHDRKREKLKRLDERGAEPVKIETTRKLIRSLSTKIRIAIQVVDKISATINKIRDEELWPQLTELIQGLTRMWKAMLECHHNQCEAIREAKALGPVGSGQRLSDSHLETTLRLEHELLNWTFRFSSWITAQKGYIRSLNSWLLKCLLYEPEDTPDGPVPFSPGRIGAPLIFVICNHWAQAMDRISEKEALASMRALAMNVFRLWEHDKVEMRQRMMANKDLERKVKLLDREDQKIQKQIHALDKKMVLATSSGDGDSLSIPVYPGDASNSSLQASLQSIFEAMERFSAESMKACEELLQRSEEERAARERDNPPST